MGTDFLGVLTSALFLTSAAKEKVQLRDSSDIKLRLKLKPEKF